MLKKFMKKAGAAMFTMALMIGLMPFTNVLASDYDYDSISKDTVLSAGDVITNNKESKLEIKYVTASESSITKKIIDENERHTLISEYDGKTFSKWKVTEHKRDWVDEDSYDYNYMITLKEYIAYKAELDKDALIGATATLSKSEEISSSDSVTLTITPNSGKTFKIDPTVDVIGGGVTQGAVSKGSDGSYTCELTSFTKDVTIEVTGEAKSAAASRPKITTNLSEAEVTYKQGDTAAPLTITAVSPEDGTLTYQWYKNTSYNSSGSTKIDGATQSSYTPPTNTAGTMYYYCRVTNTVGSTHESNTTWFAKITVTKSNKPQAPAITTANATYKIGAGKNMTFTCAEALDNFIGINIDGKAVDKSKYTVKSGSTILTLKSSYLDTLSAGKHTLKLKYKDNVSAETSFTITSKAVTNNTTGTTNKTTGIANGNKATGAVHQTTSPKTGDTTNTMLLFGMLVLSAGVVMIMGNKRRKAVSK